MSEDRARRTPPYNPHAEASLLGAMLLTQEATADAINVVDSTDFYTPLYQKIFHTIKSLYAAGKPIDTITVADELAGAATVDQLLDLQATTPVATNATHYASIVKDKALLRALIARCTDIAEMAYSDPSDVAAVVDHAETVMFAVGQHRAKDSTQHLSDLLAESLDRIEQLFERGDTITGTPTGFVDLDRITAGLQPSNLVIIGARPAMGKTSFALNIATHASLHVERPVLFFSLEMSQLEISQRLLCSDARVDATRVRNGSLDETDWARISDSTARLAKSRLWVDDDPAVTITDIRSKARRLKSTEGDLALVVVDYLQLMTGRSGAENRQVEVSEISRGLKILAREVQCPVVALSQLSRQLEQRTDKRPTLADLRESGAIEQDADVVMFLYRDDVYNPNSPDAGTAEILIAKHRSGPTGTTRLSFLPHFTRFANLAKDSS